MGFRHFEFSDFILIPNLFCFIYYEFPYVMSLFLLHCHDVDILAHFACAKRLKLAFQITTSVRTHTHTQTHIGWFICERQPKPKPKPKRKNNFSPHVKTERSK